MTEIKLELTVDETNVILEALGQMPFARVYALVAKLQEQASHQITTDDEPRKPSLVQPGEEAVAGGQ